MMHQRYIIGLVLVGLLGLGSVGEAQMGSGPGGGYGSGPGVGILGIPGTAFGGATDPSLVPLTSGFRLIPSIQVAERYDSNVLFAPNGSRGKLDDYVTTATPQLRGLYVGSLVSVNVMGRAVGEYYAKNTGLNYVGTNVGGIVDLSKLASRLWSGTQVTLSDTYSYTPQPPAFLAGDLTGQGANPFVSGYQVSRVNTQNNTFNATLVAPLTQVLSVRGSYTNGFMRFGASPAQQAGQLLNNTYQTYTTGLALDLSAQETVSLTFVGADYDYYERGTFTTRGGTVGWTRLLTPNLTLNTAAGAQLVDPNIVGTSSATSVQPLGNLALLWKDSTTTLTLAYAIGITPSFQFQSAPLRTQVVSLNLTQQTGLPELLGIVGLNFGHGEQIGAGAADLSYTSWGGTGGLAYRLTPQTFLGLTYSYANNNQSRGGQGFLIERQVVQLTLTQAFY